MSRHSQVTQQRKALQNAPRPAAANPQQKQMGLEALVPFLISSGAQIGFALQLNKPDKAMRLVAVCGPLQIPVPLDYEKARELVKGLSDALDEFDPPPDPNACESTIPPILTPEWTEGSPGLSEEMFDAIEALEPSRIIRV